MPQGVPLVLDERAYDVLIVEKGDEVWRVGEEANVSYPRADPTHDAGDVSDADAVGIEMLDTQQQRDLGISEVALEVCYAEFDGEEPGEQVTLRVPNVVGFHSPLVSL